MKMNKYFKRLALGVALAASAGLSLALFSSGNSVHAATTYYDQSFDSLKSLSKVTVPTAGDRMSSDYSFIPNFIDGSTTMKIIGSGTHWGASKAPMSNTSIKLDSSLKKGDAGALYSDVGTYLGQKVDLKITLTDWILNQHTDDSTYNLVSFANDQIGINTTGSAVATKWTFLKHGTNTPMNISGYFSFNDIDNGGVGTSNIAGQNQSENLAFPSATMAKFDNLYATSDNNLVYHDYGSFTDIASNDIQDNDADKSQERDNAMITVTFKNQSSLDMVWWPVFAAPSLPLSSFKEIWPSAANYSKLSFTDNLNATDQAISLNPNYTYSNPGAWFGFTSIKPVRSATVVPAKTVSDEDEKNVQANTLSSATETNEWKITQVIPGESTGTYYTDAYLADNIAPVWNVNSVKVTNEAGTDVTSWFNNLGAGNNYKLSVAAAKLKSNDFYNHTYTFDFKATLKPGVDLSSYLNAKGGYTFTNQGTFTTDTDTKPTNTVTTNLNSQEVNLLKTDASGKALSGIKFALADTAANAKGGKYLKKDTDGNVVYPSDNNYSSSLADYTVTTDADGKATWSGLSAAKDASQTYYYVELKTDSSHQLLTGVGAAKSGPTGAAPTTTVTNKTKIQLPSTGSTQKKEAIIMIAVLMSVLVLAGISLRKVRILGGGVLTNYIHSILASLDNSHYSSKYPEAQELTETMEKNLRREVKWNEQISKASALAGTTLGWCSSFISPGWGRDACLW
jgi:hypothetical protein